VINRPRPPVGIGHFFDLSAVISGTTAPVTSFAQPYAATVKYTDAEKGEVLESSLGLYWQDQGSWVRVPGTQVDAANNRVTAALNHMTPFAVLGKTSNGYLPIVIKMQ